MTNNRARLTADGRLMLLAVLALGLAAQAPTAQAQAASAQPAAASKPVAAASPPNNVGEVTVTPQRRIGLTPAKRKALEADAAKNEAWRRYRDSNPPLTRDPNDQSKDFPGLKTYVQH